MDKCPKCGGSLLHEETILYEVSIDHESKTICLYNGQPDNSDDFFCQDCGAKVKGLKDYELVF